MDQPFVDDLLSCHPLPGNAQISPLCIHRSTEPQAKPTVYKKKIMIIIILWHMATGGRTNCTLIFIPSPSQAHAFILTFGFRHQSWEWVSMILFLRFLCARSAPNMYSDIIIIKRHARVYTYTGLSCAQTHVPVLLDIR